MTSTPYYNEYQFILNSDYLTHEEKVKALEKLKEIIDSQLKDQLVSYLVKKWSGGLLELGSSAIPIGGAGKAGASIGGNLLKQTLGRKLSQEIGSGAVSGMASGAVFGAGQGLIEDKNPLELAIQYGASGLLVGGLTGGVAGKIIQDKNIKFVNELADKRKDWGIAYRKASGNPELAIQTLLENKRGFVPDAFNKRGIGNVDLVWGAEGKKGYGLAHIAEKRANEGYDVREFLNNIPDNVKKGKIVSKKNQPDISLIKNSQNTSIVKKVYNDKKRNWLLTSFNDYEKIPNNIGRTPDIADVYVGMTPPTYSGKIFNSQAVTGLQTSDNIYSDKQYIPLSDLGIDNSIIPYIEQTLNPIYKQNKSAAKRLMSSSPLSNISPKEGIHSTSGLAANSFIISHLNEIFNLTKKDTINQNTPSRVEGTSYDSILGSNPAYSYHNRALKLEPNNIITDVAETLNPGFKLLPAWLSSLFLSKNQSNPAVPQENMPINIPVLKGGVQVDVNLDDLTNLVNPEISKNTKIDEFPNHQYEMDEKTGIPVDYESGCFNGGTVYVNSYTRDDGTQVRGYYRSRPNRL